MQRREKRTLACCRHDLRINSSRSPGKQREGAPSHREVVASQLTNSLKIRTLRKAPPNVNTNLSGGWHDLRATGEP